MQTQRELRHRQIINMAFAGETAERIADAVGMHVASIRAIIRSPLAQAAFDAMGKAATDSVTNIPVRMRLQREFDSDAEAARRVQRAIMDDDLVDPRARLVASRHFLDRVAFATPPEPEKAVNYRDVLRKLDEIERRVELTPQGTFIIAQDVTVNNPDGPVKDD